MYPMDDYDKDIARNLNEENKIVCERINNIVTDLKSLKDEVTTLNGELFFRHTRVLEKVKEGIKNGLSDLMSSHAPFRPKHVVSLSDKSSSSSSNDSHEDDEEEEEEKKQN